MPLGHLAALNDRGVVRVGGSEAHKFLQGLLTNDLETCAIGNAQFSGLLSPQGKILFDFIIVPEENSFLLDVSKDSMAALMKRLTLYRLRADVTLSDQSNELCVFAAWGGEPNFDQNVTARVKDPRHDDLGYRIFVASNSVNETGESGSAYHAHRIALGIPEGGKDYPYDNTYPHEALYDQINGVSFTKGCFVGQEVVSRMEHRKATKKRVVQVRGNATLPSPGTDIIAGDIALGRLGSTAHTNGLALIRVDRLSDIAKGGTPAQADGVTLEFFKPDWANFDW